MGIEFNYHSDYSRTILQGNFEFWVQMSRNGMVRYQEGFAPVQRTITTTSPFYLAQITAEQADSIDFKGCELKTDLLSQSTKVPNISLFVTSDNAFGCEYFVATGPQFCPSLKLGVNGPCMTWCPMNYIKVTMILDPKV